MSRTNRRSEQREQNKTKRKKTRPQGRGRKREASWQEPSPNLRKVRRIGDVKNQKARNRNKKRNRPKLAKRPRSATEDKSFFCVIQGFLWRPEWQVHQARGAYHYYSERKN
jgi:hypothetical protein